MRKLNHRYAGLKETTDVLSFRFADKKSQRSDELDYASILEQLKTSPYLNLETGTIESPTTAPEITPELGTIFLAAPYCEKLAKQSAMETQDYLLVCCVHGMAHLAGYDHQSEEQAEEMRAVEQQAIGSLLSSGLAQDIPSSYLP